MRTKNIEYFIEKNLQYRPHFFAYIRSQEGLLFAQYSHLVRSKALDFGCGDGFFAETVFGKRKIDIGLDVPTSRMEQAARNGVYKRMLTYDGITIPLASSSVKTILSNCVFEHIPHIQKSVKEMARILIPGGYVLTSVMCSPWSDNLRGGSIGGNMYVQWFNRVQDHHALFSKKQWMRLFQKSGLTITAAHDYLFHNASQKTELYHFLSLPSLMLYTLTGKWTLGNKPAAHTVNSIKKTIQEDTKQPSACFFVLKKQ